MMEECLPNEITPLSTLTVWCDVGPLVFLVKLFSVHLKGWKFQSVAQNDLLWRLRNEVLRIWLGR